MNNMAQSLQLVTQLTRLVDSIPKTGGFPQLQVTVDSTSDLLYSATQVVGFAAEESLAAGDVTDDAMCVIFNEDDTNFVEVGSGSFTPWFKIPAGEFAILPRVSSLAAVQLRADTANVNVTVLLFKIAS